MNNLIHEPERQTPILLRADVAVAGGGPAGIAAAIAAADAGARVVLLERYGFPGGIPTICGMEPSSWCREAGTVMPGGVQALLEGEMKRRGAAHPPLFEPSAGYSYDTETMKHVLDRLLLEHGVTPVYHAVVTGPHIEDGGLRGLFIESKSGRQAVLAERVIDCTGDADIAAGCGCPFEKCALGPDEASDMMFATLIFGAANVDIPRMLAHLRANPHMLDRVRHEFVSTAFTRAREEGYPIPPHGFQNNVIFNRYTNGEVTAINRVRVPADGNDVMSVTEGEILSRREALATLELLRKYEPGFENARLRQFATAMGIRETRRITGGYQLTMEDIEGERRFPDSVGVYPVCMDGPAVCKTATDAYFHIPFGVLVPEGVENLLVAGRCVSATKDATHTTRGVDFAMATGQAAGVASALSIREGSPSGRVKIQTLQEELQKQNVRIL